MAAKRPAAKRSAAIIADLMDLARNLARDLPKSDDPSQAELLEALALAHLCALRLHAERSHRRR